MSQKGLYLRKRSDSLNENNIRRGSFANENLYGLTDDFQKFTLNEQPSGKRSRVRTSSTLDIKKLSVQKGEIRGSYRLLDKFLTSIGFRRCPSPEGNENSKQQDVSSGLNECSPPSDDIVEETKTVLDHHRTDIFWSVDLQSAHADFLVDIITYAFSIQKCNISRDQLEDLSIAAVRLAAKAESQHALSKEIIEEFDIRKLNSLERKICRAADFRLLRCSMLFFMRIVQKLVERHSWQWKFAKFASQLACCQIELITLKPTLLAGVVMRLTSLLADKDSWPSECYAVLGESSRDYDYPQSILCRLILTSRVIDEFAETYTRYGSVVEHAISLRPGWIEGQAAAANEVVMMGNCLFN